MQISRLSSGKSFIGKRKKKYVEDVAMSNRETVPQTWSRDSEGAITETSALNDTRIDV